MKTKFVHGIGVNDSTYAVTVKEYLGHFNGKARQRLIWMCPFYSTWSGMISRCYSKDTLKRSPSYEGCTTCEEWKYFSNFKAWMETQDWEGKQLDKDLLVRGNRLYGPETCIFVTATVNSFINEAQAGRGDYLIGVSLDSGTGKFRASCSHPLKTKSRYIGLFTSEIEAHQAWLKRKLEIAYELSALQDNPMISKALIERYSNYVSVE